MAWKMISDSYKFTYDAANRLKNAVYGEKDNLGTNANRFTEKVLEYDKNGNIKRLERRGRMQNGKYGLVDSLIVTYTGNQLNTVKDMANKVTYAGSLDFKGTKGTNYSYTYNGNGSLLTDKSRGIAFISYDLSGNPQKIYFTNGSITKYVYSATGQKLRMVHYTAKANISRTIGQQVELKASEIQSTDSTDYLLGGSLVVRNGKIDKYLFDGGYAQATASGTTDKFTFYYQNKDHLGTVRETVTSTGAMKQRVNYYPFGGQLVDTLKAMIWNRDFQQYKYNGKEFDNMYGLNTYDYGARQHYPILARWDRIDPLCEKYYGVSPYAYCANNPVNAIDPDGRDWVKTQWGDYIWMDNVTSAERTPDGYSYIGTTGNDILRDLNLNTDFEVQNSVGGAIGFDGDVKLGGALFGNTYRITAFVDVSAIIEINSKNSTSNNSMGIYFKGVKFDAYINQKGDSSNDNLSLNYKGNMRLQVNDKNVYTPLHYNSDPQIRQTGSISLQSSKVFSSSELRQGLFIREIGIEVGATNANALYVMPRRFTWNLMYQPIIRKK
ncbi:RHS repeat-associated core domain-containing protein [Prevotella sp. lc2012]|uniref:RHS repeat-associated core domain-containing protein n=1 Tax=Prevotella sp. lc2012 TaxID=1761886 RepID=UPI000B8296EE|nr:RHS repeat-associated core domain-containing protein [Prevotella sp. lc2012]